MQAAAGSSKSAWSVLRAVVAADGLKGLWAGATPGLVSTAMIKKVYSRCSCHIACLSMSTAVQAAETQQDGRILVGCLLDFC